MTAKRITVLLLAAALGTLAPSALAGEEAAKDDARAAFLRSLNALEFNRIEGLVRGVSVRDAIQFASEAAGAPVAVSPEAAEALAEGEKEREEIVALRDRLRFAWERFEWKGTPLRLVLAELGRKYGFKPEIDPAVLEGAEESAPPSEYADVLQKLRTRAVRLKLSRATLEDFAKALAAEAGFSVRVDKNLPAELRSRRRSVVTGKEGPGALLLAAESLWGEVWAKYEKGGFVYVAEEREPWPWVQPKGPWIDFAGERSAESALEQVLGGFQPALRLRYRNARWIVEASGGEPALPWAGSLPGLVGTLEGGDTVGNVLQAWLEPLGLGLGFAEGKLVVLPAEAARESVPRPEVLYSVAFLKGTPEDYPGHFPETGSREAMMPAIEEPRERISPLGMRETACEVVRMLLERGFGGGEGSDCELSGQTLRVRATPDVHEKVAAFLAGLREHEGRTVQVTFQFLQMDDALLTRLLGTGRLAWEALSPEQVKALQAGIERGEAKSVKRASLVAFQGQTVSSSAVRQVTYVCDYDVEVAQAAQIGDPIVAMIREGMVVQVVPVVFGDGRRILLDVRSAVAKILEPMESFATPHGAVSLPRVDFQRIGTSLILNDGGSVLLGGAGSLAVGKSLVLWLQAGLPETAREGPAPSAVHDRLLRVFDLRDLTHGIPDHAGPEVGLVVGSEESGASAAFMDAGDDPQAGERYDPSMIRSLVMERVYPESWDEGAHFAELVLGHLVVVNRREALAKIEGLLAEMRERRVRGVEVVTRFLSIPAADLAPVLEQGAKEKGRAFLSPEQAGKILALADRDPAARLSTTVFPLFHKQRASLQTGRSIPYVRDLDVEVAQNAAVGDPITGRLLEGTFLDYRAEIDPAEDEATLELRPTLALLKKMTVSDVGGGRNEEGKKGEGQEGPLQPPLVGRIMLPELELQKIRATLTLRNGSTALLFCPSEAGADSGRDLVLLVSVRTMGTGKK